MVMMRRSRKFGRERCQETRPRSPVVAASLYPDASCGAWDLAFLKWGLCVSLINLNLHLVYYSVHSSSKFQPPASKAAQNVSIEQCKHCYSRGIIIMKRQKHPKPFSRPTYSTTKQASKKTSPFPYSFSHSHIPDSFRDQHQAKKKRYHPSTTIIKIRHCNRDP